LFSEAIAPHLLKQKAAIAHNQSNAIALSSFDWGKGVIATHVLKQKQAILRSVGSHNVRQRLLSASAMIKAKHQHPACYEP
jgi:hypothetical protein